jgi:iron complex transport system substrate-binding protein
MSTHHSRRGFLGIVSAATVSVACAPGGGDSGGAVTIKHIFGKTTVPGPPQRVVSAGLTEQDDLLAVGVVPIAVTNWFGNQPLGVWPWAQSDLGNAKPVVLNLDNGIPVDQIARLSPDLIIAINAGLDSDTYQKLSAIAPTIAQSGGDAFFEPWRDQAATVGKAVFRTDQMTTLIDGVIAKFAAVGDANPNFKDRRALLLDGRFSGDIIGATVDGWRTDFLTAMGFQIPDRSGEITRTELAGALEGIDVLIWCTTDDTEQALLLAEPAIAGLRKRNIFTNLELAGAIAFASPLSYPIVAEQLPPLLARALA